MSQLSHRAHPMLKGSVCASLVLIVLGSLVAYSFESSSQQMAALFKDSLVAVAAIVGIGTLSFGLVNRRK